MDKKCLEEIEEARMELIDDLLFMLKLIPFIVAVDIFLFWLLGTENKALGCFVTAVPFVLFFFICLIIYNDYRFKKSGAIENYKSRENKRDFSRHLID
jgi:hypothetical protein